MSSEITNALTISGKSLPFDLIENILSRLPVKSLKRFRAVEKSWRSLIDSKGFAKSHLRRSLQTNSNRNLVCGVFGFNSIDLDKLDNKPRSLPELFTYEYGDIHAVSNSVNGLVVVKCGDPEPLALWNPFTSQYKFLPCCPRPSSASVDPNVSCKIMYGFGYDSKNDDYKVVKVMLYSNPFSVMSSEEWIYGLKSDCWRRIKGTNYDMGDWPTHVNGVLHSTVQNNPADPFKIMGFSVETEEVCEVPWPEIDLKGLGYISLEVFDGCLALVRKFSSRIVIWVMEEYGVKESWKPLLSLAVAHDTFVRPLVYSKDRDKILLNYCCKGIAVFCLRTQNVINFINFPMPYAFSPGVCVETLISPYGWDKEIKKKKKKKRDGFLSSGFNLVL